MYNKAYFDVYKNNYGVCTDGNCRVNLEFKEMEKGQRIKAWAYNQYDFNCKGNYKFQLRKDTAIRWQYELYDKLSRLTLYAVIFELETNHIDKSLRIYVDNTNALEIKKEVAKVITEEN